MATRTYEIKPRHQYDPDGARVEFGGLMTSYSLEDGRLVIAAGEMCRVSDLDQVRAAVLRVMQTKQAETLVLGEVAPPLEPVEDWKSERGSILSEEMDREDSIY